MAIIPVDKLSLLGLQTQKDAVFNRLLDFGITQPIEPSNLLSSDELSEMTFLKKQLGSNLLERRLEKISSVIKLLSEYDSDKKPLFANKRHVPQKQWKKFCSKKEWLESLAEQLLDENQKVRKLQTQIIQKKNQIVSLSPWKNLDISLSENQMQYGMVIFGAISSVEDKDSFCHEVDVHMKERVQIQNVSTDATHAYFCIFLQKKDQTLMEQVLKKWGFVVTKADSLGVSPKKATQKLEKECIELEDAIKNIYHRFQSNASRKAQFELFYDVLSIQKQQEDALKNLLQTNQTFYLQVWIPKPHIQTLKDTLESEFDLVIETVPVKETDKPPVVLQNNHFVQSVEPVTQMYGLPGAKDIDPNQVVSIFFILFFGLMLSDGGYGLVMASVSAFFLYRIKPSGTLQKYSKLMMYCGISTMFWGLLFGGWFGIEAFSNTSLWFNPIEDQKEFLKWALAFGVIHLFTGVAVRGYNLFRQRKYLDILWDCCVWYVFYLGFIFFTLPYVPNIDPSSVSYWTFLSPYFLGIGSVLLLLTQGRKEKKFVMKLIKGLGSLYQLIGFMSDVLSYSRLLALGLATSVIATNVNEIALKVGLGTVVGWIVFILVVIVGHAFNFAINALGAYVHSGRLQYIEFFSKFYQGGGKPFLPFKMQTKFVQFNFKWRE